MPKPGDQAFVALYNNVYRAPPGVDPGWLVSRADYGVAGHTPVQHHAMEGDARLAAKRMNEALGIDEKDAFEVVASTMPSRAGHPRRADVAAKEE